MLGIDVHANQNVAPRGTVAAGIATDPLKPASGGKAYEDAALLSE